MASQLQVYGLDILTSTIDSTVPEASIRAHCSAREFFANQSVCEKILLAHMRFESPLSLILELDETQIDVPIEELFKELQFYSLGLSFIPSGADFEAYTAWCIKLLQHWLTTVDTNVQFCPGSYFVTKLTKSELSIPQEDFSGYMERFVSQFTADQFNALTSAAESCIQETYSGVGGLKVVATTIAAATLQPIKKFYEVAGKSASALLQ